MIHYLFYAYEAFIYLFLIGIFIHISNDDEEPLTKDDILPLIAATLFWTILFPVFLGMGFSTFMTKNYEK